MQSKILKSVLLFVVAVILIQVFYVVTSRLDLFAEGRYFPYGYIVHILYYLSLFGATFLFVGKFDFAAVGLKRVAFWKFYLQIGIGFALLNFAIKAFVFPATIGQNYTIPVELYIPAYVLLGFMISLAEESAFRGYILRDFLQKYGVAIAILASSILFGVYHIDFVDLNYFNLYHWFWYVVQAFTGGIFMALLYYKTGGNIIAPIAYHSANIIIGQALLWTPLVNTEYLLAVESVINLLQVALLILIPIKKSNEKTVAQGSSAASVS